MGRMPCSHMDDCQVYKLMPAGLQLWKTLYCQNEEKYPQCARFQMASKGETIPLNLLPNGKLLYVKKDPQKGT
jgi:hypothetical protein